MNFIADHPVCVFLAVVVLGGLAFGFGYFVLGPIRYGRLPFSPPDGKPADRVPWKPWRKLER